MGVTGLRSAAEIVVEGRVQGVGFRYTAQDIARNFKVSGYVRNLPDGNVELVAEGDPSEIERFLEAIAEKMEGFVKKRSDFDSPASGEYSGFSIRR